MRTLFTSLLLLCLLASLHAVTLSGSVLGPDGRSVAGARVSIPRIHSLTTDTRGRFTFELPAKDVHEGNQLHVTVYKPGLAVVGARLQEGTNVITLQKGLKLTGRVVNGLGKPVAGTHVEASSIYIYGVDSFSVPDDLRGTFTATTKADGAWVLRDLPQNGTATLTLRDERYLQSQIQAKLNPAYPHAPGLTAEPAAILSGRVVTPDGKPGGMLTIDIEIRSKTRSGTRFGTTYAVTNADGTFRKGSLEGGNANIVINDPSQQWTATPREGIVLTAGQETKLPVIVLARGVVLKGVVVDTATDAPIPHTLLYCQGEGANHQVVVHTETKDDGSFQFRVPPGSYHFGMLNVPGGYLSKQNIRNIHIKGGGEVNLGTVRLEKGLTVSGTAVDIDGHPVAGVRLNLSRYSPGRRSYTAFGASVHTDAEGKFNAGGLAPGEMKLSTGESAFTPGGWKVESPGMISLPTDGEITVVLRKIDAIKLTGRVVTPDGQPVAQAEVQFECNQQFSEHSFGSFSRQCMTDGQGAYSLDGLLPTAKITFKGAHKSGYLYRSGGNVRPNSEAFHAEDILLLPLASRLTGRVVNAAQRPLAGVKLLALESCRHAVSDATGRFTLDNLPEGQVTVVAAQGQGATLCTVQTGAVPVTITLLPRKPLPEKDEQRAMTIIRAGISEVHDTDYARTILPLALASANPELALQLANENGKIPADLVVKVITGVAAADKARAAAWAPSRLALIANPKQRAEAMLTLGMAVAGQEPDMAAELYRQAKQQLLNGGPQAMARLAALAARVKNGEDAALIQQAIANTRTVRAADWMTIDLLRTFAQGNPEQALKIADELPDPVRIDIYVECVRLLSQTDPAAARRLLAKIKTKYRISTYADRQIPRVPEADRKYEQAMQYVILSIGKRDPAGALALARSVCSVANRPRALALAATFQEKATALRMLRAVAQSLSPDHADSMIDQVRVARLAYEIDPPTGTALFNQALVQVKKHYGLDSAILSQVLYYGSKIDPAECRILLEESFAQQLQKQRFTPDGDFISDQVYAMASMDLDRALEMTKAIANERQQITVRSKIAAYALASYQVRNRMPFNAWYNDANEICCPQTPVGW